MQPSRLFDPSRSRPKANPATITNGRTTTIRALAAGDDLLDALLVAYYPGPYGARAIARTLFGELNPSGRLPYTMRRSTGQLPIYYGQKRGRVTAAPPADQHHGYIGLSSTPLYLFGHGLTYTTFEHGPVSLEVATDGGVIAVQAEITNTGRRRGTEAVQFYVSGTASGMSRPELQLVGFTRLDLEPGEIPDGALRDRRQPARLHRP